MSTHRPVRRHRRRHHLVWWLVAFLVVGTVFGSLGVGAILTALLLGGGWRSVHWMFLIRAAARGPKYMAGYEVRRGFRRAGWRLTRRWR